MNKKHIGIGLSCLAIGLLLGAIVGYAQTPSSTFWISGGIYPSMPSFTVWREGSEYFAKNDNGLIVSANSNASIVIQYAMNSLSQNPSYAWRRGTVYVKEGNYTLDVPLVFRYGTQLIGEKAILNVNNTDVFDLTYSPTGGGVTEVTIQGFSIYNLGNGSGIVLHGVGMQDCTFKDIHISGNFERYIYSQNWLYGANKNTYQNFYMRYNNYNSSRINVHLERNATSGVYEYNSRFVNVVSWGGGVNFDVYGDRLYFEDCVAYGLTGNQGDGFRIRGRHWNVLMDTQLENLAYGVRLWNDTLGTTIINLHQATVTDDYENLVDYYVFATLTNIVDIRSITELHNYLHLTNRYHPTTTGWNSSQAGYLWYCINDTALEYWDGSSIVTP